MIFPPTLVNSLAGFCYRLLRGRYIRNQRLRNVVALLQVRWAVVGDPSFSIAIFPYQHLQREINCNTGSWQHD